MSRTFRRKGFERTQGATWDRRGDKVAGYYTRYEWDRAWGWLMIFRKPTKQEFYENYWRIHGDSHRNAWSPSRGYRERRQRENRSINKNEIQKWVKNPDYEPLTESDPRSCLWDWS